MTCILKITQKETMQKLFLLSLAVFFKVWFHCDIQFFQFFLLSYPGGPWAIISKNTQDTLAMRPPPSPPFSAIGINWFDSHVWRGTHDRHQFQPGGPADRLQVRRGQETREGSCLVPSGVLKWRQGRSKVTHVNSCEGKKLQCISHINVATCLSNSLHASLPTFNFLLLFSCLSYDC